jgi:hypothetical protein
VVRVGGKVDTLLHVFKGVVPERTLALSVGLPISRGLYCRMKVAATVAHEWNPPRTDPERSNRQ